MYANRYIPVYKPTTWHISEISAYNIYICNTHIHGIHILTVFAVKHLTEISGEYIRKYNRNPYPI